MEPQRKIWKLGLPDWAEIDTVWKFPQPFALWTIGEQALLFHWLDAAVDNEVDHLVLYVADRPASVREAMEANKLWPITWEIKAVPTIQSDLCDEIVNRLPKEKAPLHPLPEDGWSLIQYWRKIENDWLDIFVKETEAFGQLIAVGKHCEISANAKLIPPYWIGDFVSIGPGCQIGPYAVIEDGCVLEGGNCLEDTHMGHHTYLGPETDLKKATLFRNLLINLKYQARVDNLEPFLASNVNSNKPSIDANTPDWRERLVALLALLSWGNVSPRSEESFTGIDGKTWPTLPGPKLSDRAAWLKLVFLGKMRLFGVPPREETALSDISKEWQSILREAPVGAFSYADVMSAQDIGSIEEAMHCVYQITGDPESCKRLFSAWFRQNVSKASGMLI